MTARSGGPPPPRDLSIVAGANEFALLFLVARDGAAARFASRSRSTRRGEKRRGRKETHLEGVLEIHEERELDRL